MRLREWDCEAAPAAELRSWLRAYNLALAFDLPDDPAWGVGMLREYLTVTMPGERRLTWLAENIPGHDGPGGDGRAGDGRGEADGSPREVLGYGRLLMLGDLGVIELYVVPEARRTGVGTSLLSVMVDRAVAEGFTSLGVEVVGGTPAIDFYRALGFRHVYTEMRSLLDLSRVEWPQVADMAGGVVPGYRVELHPLDLPDELLPGYAKAKQVRRLDPDGDLELRPSSYDAERLRASLRCLRARGLKPYLVVAIHERSGDVAGLTELVVPAQHPSRADQYDTIIVPEHNGYGLARTIKARMLLELRRAEPQLRQVQTWHAAEREQLQQVNKELGFRPDREWREYEADARNLAARVPASI